MILLNQQTLRIVGATLVVALLESRRWLNALCRVGAHKGRPYTILRGGLAYCGGHLEDHLLGTGQVARPRGALTAQLDPARPDTVFYCRLHCGPRQIDASLGRERSGNGEGVGLAVFPSVGVVFEDVA